MFFIQCTKITIHLVVYERAVLLFFDLQIIGEVKDAVVRVYARLSFDTVDVCNDDAKEQTTAVRLKCRSLEVNAYTHVSHFSMTNILPPKWRKLRQVGH